MNAEPENSIFGGSSGAWLVVGITATIIMVMAIIGGMSSERQHVRYAAGACLNNLHRINGAKETWALETKADDWDIIWLTGAGADHRLAVRVFLPCSFFTGGFILGHAFI